MCVRELQHYLAVRLATPFKNDESCTFDIVHSMCLLHLRERQKVRARNCDRHCTKRRLSSLHRRKDSSGASCWFWRTAETRRHIVGMYLDVVYRSRAALISRTSGLQLLLNRSTVVVLHEQWKRSVQSSRYPPLGVCTRDISRFAEFAKSSS